MEIVSLIAIKEWFKTGKRPTEEQFRSVWDAFRHKHDKIPLAQIEEIESVLNDKADTTSLDSHFVDPSAHTELFDKKVDKRKGYDLSKNDFTDVLKTKLQNLEYSNFKGQYNNLDDLKKACPEGKPLGKEQGYYAFVQMEQITLFIWDNKKYIWVEQKQLSNLQEITDKGNVTSNAIQITGAGKIDPNIKSLFAYYTDGTGTICMANPSAALTSEKLAIGIAGAGSSNFLILTNQTDKQAAITLSSTMNTDIEHKADYLRIQGADAVNEQDYVPLNQLKSLIPKIPDNIHIGGVLDKNIIQDGNTFGSTVHIGTKDNYDVYIKRNNSTIFRIAPSGIVWNDSLGDVDNVIKNSKYELSMGKNDNQPMSFTRIANNNDTVPAFIFNAFNKISDVAQFQIVGSVKAGVRGNGSIYGSDATRENEFTTLSQVKNMIEKVLNEKIKELEKK